MSGLIDLSKVRQLSGPAARKALLVVAQESQNAERFLDMHHVCCDLIKHVAQLDDEPWLSDKERRCVAIAFKNVTCQLRAAWEVVPVPEGGDAEVIAAFDDYKRGIREELMNHCKECQQMMESLNSPNADPESKAFSLKIIADYHRYMAEVSPDNNAHGERALEKYEEGMAVAKALEPTNPIAIGLALNLSVLYFAILNDANRAVEVAKSAFNAAIGKLDRIVEAHYNDTTLVMQLLRDNISHWSVEPPPKKAAWEEDGKEDGR